MKNASQFTYCRSIPASPMRRCDDVDDFRHGNGRTDAGRSTRAARHWKSPSLRAMHQMIDNPPSFPIRSPDESLARTVTPCCKRRVPEPGDPCGSARVWLFASGLRRTLWGGGWPWRGQYVLLGAGLDTFACRQCDSSRPRIRSGPPRHAALETSVLESSGLGVPEKLTFVPVDFGRSASSTRSKVSGFDFNSPALFAMLGVAVYVSGNRPYWRRLGSIASLGSELVFDYTEPYQDAPPAHCGQPTSRLAHGLQKGRALDHAFQTPTRCARR